MDNEPLLSQLQHCPVTALICLSLILVSHATLHAFASTQPLQHTPNHVHTHTPPQIWFPLWNNRVPVDKVAFSYRRVIQHREYWRILTAAHSHFDLFHLGFNVMSLWSCRYAEVLLGSWVFFVESLTLAIACKLVMLLIIYGVHSRFRLTK